MKLFPRYESRGLSYDRNFQPGKLHIFYNRYGGTMVPSTGIKKQTNLYPVFQSRIAYHIRGLCIDLLAMMHNYHRRALTALLPVKPSKRNPSKF